ncbi:SPOPL [Cordylochernes scorpioides]|uniref:SPOPL n=1 Tax=Cordylochernes scorpioides TaxID=51811 RepID=A0ABY6KM07_9ARAC|nr:SPOPL [Cordylochernes scorpioides]
MDDVTSKDIKTSFIWTIDNFSFHQENVGDYIESSSFPTPGEDALKWNLRLYPNGSSKKSEGFLSLFLCLESEVCDIDIKYSFSFLTSTKNKFNVEQVYKKFPKINYKWGFPTFFKKSSLFDQKDILLPKDQLTIFCEIIILHKLEDVIMENIFDLQFKVPECSWSQDMNLLLESHNFSDVTIHVGDRMFQAHKNILAARSSVFEAMFEHDMKDQNLINITNVEPTVMQELLRFMYTGNSMNVKGMAEKLLAGAANYGLERLKVLCEMSLASALSPNNAGDVLVLADRYQAKQLKAFTIRFINTHSLAVIDSEGWKSNLSQQSHLITELLMAQASYKFPLCCEMIYSEAKEIETSKFWCHTEDKIITSFFKWTINRYISKKTNSEICLQSPRFFSNQSENLKWCLEAYLDGVNEESQGFLSIFLKLESTDKTEVNSKFELALINEKGDKSNYMEFTHKFTKDGKKGGSSLFIKNDFLIDEKNGLLPDDKLTIVCDMKVIEESIVSSGVTNDYHFWIPASIWSEEIGSLLESLKFSDVVLKTWGHTVHAHKNILAARSPVFAAMFEHEMKENRESLVEIEDMEPVVLRGMIRFIYTGQSPNLKTIADRLLPAADKYGLERLKAICEVSLASNLSLKNAAKLLVLADTYNALQLKTRIMSFISEHYKEIMKINDWCLKAVTQPHLLAEIYLICAYQRVQCYHLPEEKDTTIPPAT